MAATIGTVFCYHRNGILLPSERYSATIGTVFCYHRKHEQIDSFSMEV
jgi:hypothetical protein